MWEKILETLRKVMIISDVQKRQEEDIKELKQYMLRFTAEIQRMSDRIEMNDTRSKSDLENLARQTKSDLEILSLKMQLAISNHAPKPEQAKLVSGDGHKPTTRTKKGSDL